MVIDCNIKEKSCKNCRLPEMLRFDEFRIRCELEKRSKETTARLNEARARQNVCDHAQNPQAPKLTNFVMCFFAVVQGQPKTKYAPRKAIRFSLSEYSFE